MRNWVKTRAHIFQDSLKRRCHRVYRSLIPITQAAVAASVAWWVATLIFPDTKPFFAPVSAIIALAPVPGRRIKRSVEIGAGTIAGVLIGELIIARIGSGVWQIGFVVFLAMVMALFLGSGMLVSVQAASSAILIATLIPPHGPGGLQRVWHAIIGTLIGIIVMALIPANPIRDIRRRLAAVVQTERDVLGDVAIGLRTHNTELVTNALVHIRATQPALNDIRDTLYNGAEVVRISPLLWYARKDLEKWEKFIEPLDNTVRNTRVLARRAVVILDDNVQLDERLLDAISQLSDATGVVQSMFAEHAKWRTTEHEATQALMSVAVRTGFQLEPDDPSGMHGLVMQAQIRSTLIDLLQVCGMTREEAVQAVPAVGDTGHHPA